MPVIKSSCVRDLKLRVNLEEVVSRVVNLRKSGSRLKGLCPFHSEKTPSFHVDPDKGYYKCFGCGKAGDSITFVRETEQLTFTEAVEALGQRFGIVIEYEEGSGPSREDRSLRQELYDLHEQAADHYHENFKAAQPAGEFMRAYWTDQRKFPMELAGEFKIGAAPPDDGGLAARLWKRKYSEDALRQCGLFFVRDGAALTAKIARTPVQCPQAVEDCSADAELCITAELNLFIWIEFLKSIDQSQYSGAYQVLDVDVLRQSFMNSSC